MEAKILAESATMQRMEYDSLQFSVQSYTLGHRLTRKELTSNFTEALDKAQSDYTTAVLSQVELYNVSESEKAETYAEMTEEAFEKFTLSECIDMRHTLIAVSVLKLSNRSKELTTMTLTEARKPVNKTKEGEPYKIISVRDHKRSSSGKPAPVALTETAFSVLLKYIQFVRPRLASEGSELVFTTSTSSPANPTGRLSYPAINRILAKAENSIQRPTGSRIFRSSRITNSRKNKISAPEAKTWLRA